MGQYKTNFRDTVRLFQVTNGHRESFHKKTVMGKKIYILMMMRRMIIIIYLFLRWGSSRRLNLCLSFCFSLSHDTDASQRHSWTETQISEK